MTVDRYIHKAAEIEAAALKLLRAELPIEIRLMGLRMSNFWEIKREPGQLSLEHLLQWRQQAQHSALPSNFAASPQCASRNPLRNVDPTAATVDASNWQRHSNRDGRAHCLSATSSVAAAKPLHQHGSSQQGGDQDNEFIHTSQVLSAGDVLELTLRDWQVEEGGPGSPAPSLPGSPEKWGSGASDQKLEVRRRQGDGGEMYSAPGDHEAYAALQPQPTQTSAPGAPRSWACVACTFVNVKLFSVCEVCNTPRSKSGRDADREMTDMVVSRGWGAGRVGGKRRKTGNGKGHGKKAAGSILAYLTKHEQQPQHQQEQQCPQHLQLPHLAGPSEHVGSPRDATADAMEDVIECSMCG
jgi:hypothetical protein